MYNKKIPIDISCGFRIAIEVMGGKWKPYIIYELLDGPKRPSALGLPLATRSNLFACHSKNGTQELQRRMPEASERVLAQQLKELMEYGVVQKRVIDPVCRHSEYSLTELGHTLIPIIEQLRDWGRSAEGRLQGKNDFRPRMEEILKEKEGK